MSESESISAEPKEGTNATRERIFSAALYLFSRNGFDGTSVREIAERAGVTKPVLYYHYGSKEQLYIALILHCYECAREVIEPAADGSGDLRTRLRRLTRAHFECFARQRDAMALLYAVAFAPRKGAPDFDFGEYDEIHIEILSRPIRDAVSSGEIGEIDVRLAATHLNGMIHLHLMNWIVFGRELAKENADAIADFCADALIARTKGLV